MMTNNEFAAKLRSIAKDSKTLYVMGCFGAPMTDANKKRYTKNNAFNKAADRVAMINGADADTFGFDCVGLIKGVLWGWKGDKTATYGGAVYRANDVPDIGADSMIKACQNVSTDFSKIEVGEAVWLKGHIGVYIGDGLAVECSPKWENKVQITACNCTKNGYNRRDWTKHGKLPYVKYEAAPQVPKDPDQKGSDFRPGDLVTITGTKYYNGKNIPSWVLARNWYVLQAEGARVVINQSEDGKFAIRSAVNAADLKPAGSKRKKTVDELAHEVLRGLWGNGVTRRLRLIAAGYDYAAVQKRVNELMK